jgi:hypothetical protein
VIAGLLINVDRGRGRLAQVAALRWARIGPIALAIPAAFVAVAIAFVDQLGRPIGGLPFGLLWLAGTAAVVGGARLLSAVSPASPVGRSWPALALVAWVVVGWLLFDVLLWQQTNHLYDFNVYLGSAGRWLDGGQPYMTAPVTAWPSSAERDFFLYPPPLLPVFGLLSRLPNAPVTAGWVGFLVVCSYASFRALGLRPIYSLLLLAFPPVMIGFESGNVAALTFLLFAAAYRTGGGLVVDGLFKVQSGLPALWLIRTGRWRGLAIGVAIVAVIVIATLPLVGADSWRAWLAGLGYRAQSQPGAPEMFGFSYARYLPGGIFVALSLLAVGVALLFSGRRGLAALGLASIFASPALWPHGFVFALPAVLLLESGPLVWLVLGAGCLGANMWLLFAAGWIAVAASRRLPDRLHPMAGTDGPWPRAAAALGQGAGGRGSRAGGGPGLPPEMIRGAQQ